MHVFSLKSAAKWLIAMLAVMILASSPTLSSTADARIPAEQMTTTTAADQGLVFHHLRRYEPAVDILEREGPPLLRRATGALGIEQMPTIDVWVLPKVSDYFELKQLPHGAPEWAVGLSFSDRHEIIVAHGGQRPPREVMRTFAHELAHVAVDQGRQGHFVPRWFNEGFAVLMADEWTPERSEKLARAAAGDTLKSFDRLAHTFPAHHQSASLAYDQSFHFVRWLQHEYGDDLFARVFEEIRQGEPFRQALEAQTDTSFGRLEARWRDELTETTTFWSILRDDLVIFFGAGVLFLVAYVIVRRRRRRQFESMEDDDGDQWDYDASRYPLPGESPAD